MDTQTGAATGLFGLSLDTLKLSSADYTQLCGLWVGRVQFLSDRYLQDSGDAHPAWHAFPVPPDHVELLQALIRNGEALSSHIAAGSHWAVLCTGTKRLEALRSAFAAAPASAAQPAWRWAQTAWKLWAGTCRKSRPCNRKNPRRGPSARLRHGY